MQGEERALSWGVVDGVADGVEGALLMPPCPRLDAHSVLHVRSSIALFHHASKSRAQPYRH